jgi:hypothetical protein
MPCLLWSPIFIAVLTRIWYLTLSWVRWIKSISLYSVPLRFILRVSFHLALGPLCGFFRFTDQNFLCIFYIRWESSAESTTSRGMLQQINRTESRSITMLHRSARYIILLTKTVNSAMATTYIVSGSRIFKTVGRTKAHYWTQSWATSIGLPSPEFISLT